jgi:hypothetical protein
MLHFRLVIFSKLALTGVNSSTKNVATDRELRDN